jgi:LacI family transcriptional regulator
VLFAARTLGIGVPDEVEIVGFNDSELAQPLGLTSVAQPFEESGAVAAKLLIDQMSDPAAAARSVTLGVTLVSRSTTGDGARPGGHRRSRGG